MPYPCRMVEQPRTDTDDWRNLRPGDMWLSPAVLENHAASVFDGGGEILAARYFSEHAIKRPPLVVCLPNGSHWVVDGRAFGKTGKDPEGHQLYGYHGEGWEVKGEPPAISTQPSINYVGSYHGYITDGVVLDDVDGRAAEHTAHWARIAAEDAAEPKP